MSDSGKGVDIDVEWVVRVELKPVVGGEIGFNLLPTIVDHLGLKSENFTSLRSASSSTTIVSNAVFQRIRVDEFKDFHVFHSIDGSSHNFAFVRYSVGIQKNIGSLINDPSRSVCICLASFSTWGMVVTEQVVVVVEQGREGGHSMFVIGNVLSSVGVRLGNIDWVGTVTTAVGQCWSSKGVDVLGAQKGHVVDFDFFSHVNFFGLCLEFFEKKIKLEIVEILKIRNLRW